MWIPKLCNVHILLIFYSFRCWSVLLFVCTLKAVKRNVMVHFTVHLRLMLLVRLYCFRRVCVGWHYRDSRFCHSALVVLDGVHMRMKSIDSSLLALWRLIHNLGLPHTCVRARCDKHAHTHTHKLGYWSVRALLTPDLLQEAEWRSTDQKLLSVKEHPPSPPSLTSPLSPSQYSLKSQCLAHMRSDSAWGWGFGRQEG